MDINLVGQRRHLAYHLNHSAILVVCKIQRTTYTPLFGKRLALDIIHDIHGCKNTLGDERGSRNLAAALYFERFGA